MARRSSYLVNLVSARFILPMLIIFGALLRETCQKPFKVTSEDCRRECDAISADHAKAKASTIDRDIKAAYGNTVKNPT